MLTAGTRVVNEEEAVLGRESGVAKVRAAAWSRITVFERIVGLMLRYQ